MKNNKTLSAYLGLFLMTTIVGLAFIFVKIGLEYTSAVDLLAHRFSIALISVITLLMLRVIKIPKPSYKKLINLIGLSIFYPVLFFLFQALGMQYSSASEAGIIFAMLPIITLIVAQIFLKETTTILQKTGIILSVLGIVYIILNKGGFANNSNNIKGFVLLFVSILSFTGYLVLGKKKGVHFTPVEMTVWITIIACVIFNIWSIFKHLQNGTIGHFFQPFEQGNFIWSILYLGILSTVLTSFLTNYALPIIPASQIAVFNNLSPIFAVIGGILFLNETLYGYHILGGILVFIGIAMTVVFKNKRKYE